MPASKGNTRRRTRVNTFYPRTKTRTIQRTVPPVIKPKKNMPKTILEKIKELSKHKPIASKEGIDKWVAIFNEIDPPEIVETTGLIIDDNAKLVSNEGGEILPEQYTHLIDALEDRLQSAYGNKKQVFREAIKFVKKQRDAENKAVKEVDDLADMMRKL
jgi:hypothetical protein